MHKRFVLRQPVVFVLVNFWWSDIVIEILYPALFPLVILHPSPIKIWNEITLPLATEIPASHLCFQLKSQHHCEKIQHLTKPLVDHLYLILYLLLDCFDLIQPAEVCCCLHHFKFLRPLHLHFFFLKFPEQLGLYLWAQQAYSATTGVRDYGLWWEPINV